MSCGHRILTRESYTGVHHYKCTDSRLKRQRPKEEWVAISAADHRGRCLCAREGPSASTPLDRNPHADNKQRSASDRHRAHCESCGRPLMIRTGKSGRYRYYACSGYRLKGLRACGKPMANVSPTSLIGATWLDRRLDPNNVNYDA